jgi:hypothetical protein
MLRDIEVDNAATIVSQDDEDIQDLETKRRDCEEINGYQLSNMIAKKRHPSLSGLPVLWHQSRNSPLGNLEPEFQELTVDTWGSPDGIGGSHGSHQLANLQIHLWASWLFRLGQSPPVPFESRALPSSYGFRPNEFKRRSPVLPDLLQRNPQQSISIAQSWSLFLTREDGQLVTKRDIFQGDVLVTAEDESQESNRQKK